METTMMGYIGFRLVWGLGFRSNGKEKGNYYNGLYRGYYKDPCLHSFLTKGKTSDIFPTTGPYHGPLPVSWVLTVDPQLGTFRGCV